MGDTFKDKKGYMPNKKSNKKKKSLKPLKNKKMKFEIDD